MVGQSRFFLAFLLEEGILLRCQFVVLSAQVDNLVFFVLYFIVLVLSNGRLDHLDPLLQAVDLLQLLVLLATVLLLQLLPLLHGLKFIGSSPLDDCANDSIQFLYFREQTFVLLGESDSIVFCDLRTVVIAADPRLFH